MEFYYYVKYSLCNLLYMCNIKIETFFKKNKFFSSANYTDFKSI